MSASPWQLGDRHQSPTHGWTIVPSSFGPVLEKKNMWPHCSNWLMLFKRSILPVIPAECETPKKDLYALSDMTFSSVMAVSSCVWTFVWDRRRSVHMSTLLFMNNDQSLPLFLCVGAIVSECFRVKGKRLYSKCMHTCATLAQRTEATSSFDWVPRKICQHVFYQIFILFTARQKDYKAFIKTMVLCNWTRTESQQKCLILNLRCLHCTLL